MTATSNMYVVGHVRIVFDNILALREIMVDLDVKGSRTNFLYEGLDQWFSKFGGLWAPF